MTVLFAGMIAKSATSMHGWGAFRISSESLNDHEMMLLR